MSRFSIPPMLVILLCALAIPHADGGESKLVKVLADVHLDMLPWNEQGDRIPTYSYCG